MILKYLTYIGLATLLAFSGSSHGATVSYGLNENNIGFSNGIDYATVKISDDGESGVPAGDIVFDITLNGAFFTKGSNFGLQALYFNSALDLTGLGSMVNGPAGWSYDFDFGTDPNDGFNASEFGRFDIEYKGEGNSRADPLGFRLTVAGDSLLNYALDNEKGFAFAAHIAGFDNGGEESGWFSTSVSPIPVPAAFWLFGTALIGFIGYSRRRSV